jgi:hypothetical protein
LIETIELPDDHDLEIDRAARLARSMRDRV